MGNEEEHESDAQGEEGDSKEKSADILLGLVGDSGMVFFKDQVQDSPRNNTSLRS